MRYVIYALMLLGMVAAQRPGFAQARAFTGPLQAVGNGNIATFVSVDANGAPSAIGMTFTPGVLNCLPAAVAEYPLALPVQGPGMPFTHFVLDWEPQGHEPLQYYGVPHFDFHFYLISPAVRNQITATGEDLARVEKTPPAQFVPQGYVATPGGVPRMGAHWINPASPEYHGQPFTTTFIYGFYNGQLAFYEPMISRAFLLTAPAVDMPIAQPQAFQTPGYYPTRYRVMYDPAQQLFTVALTGMTLRQ